MVGNRLFPTFAGQGHRPVLRRLRRLRRARRPGPDQPDLAVGPVQPGAGVGRRRSRTGTSASSTGRRASSRRGTSTCPATTRSRRCSGRRSSSPALMFTVLALYPIIERKLTGDTASHHLLQRPRDVPVRTVARGHGADLLPGADDLRRQRRHRRQVRHQPQRDDVGRPHRRDRPAADRLRDHLPDLPGSAAARPRGARARHRDRRHPAAAARRVHRGPPAARPGRRARPRSARLRRRSGAQADEPGRRRPPGDPRASSRPIEEPAAGRARAAGRGPRARRRRARPRRADALRAVPPRAGARPRVAGRRSRATDLAPHAHQQGPGGLHRGPSACRRRASRDGRRRRCGTVPRRAWPPAPGARPRPPRAPTLGPATGDAPTGAARCRLQGTVHASRPRPERAVRPPSTRLGHRVPAPRTTRAPPAVREGPSSRTCEVSSAGRSAPRSTRTAGRRW